MKYTPLFLGTLGTISTLASVIGLFTWQLDVFFVYSFIAIVLFALSVKQFR
jgi:hypothetical protein